MLTVLRDSWALLLGLLLLMLGNGLQGTLLGVRGAMEGMAPSTIAYVMSAYFVGLLIGARVTPLMIARVGHVRVFAALASMISAGFILYAAAPNPWVWAAMRLMVGFCFCGVYVVTESWLNDRATNETRGQAMSAYMFTQMAGIVAAQGILTLADPGGYTLFVIMSVLVSISFAPILLTVTPAPAFQTAKPMSLRQLYGVSPLGCVSVLLLGAMFSASFGMAAVYGAQAGLSVRQISLLVSAIYVGGLLFQWPIGWVSDRMDRRKLIVIVCTAGAAAAFMAAFLGYTGVVIAAFLLGGAMNPLYSLIIAYTNDYLKPDDMAAASGGMLFLNGIGAVGGPLAVGFMMDRFGPPAFFIYIAMFMAAISVYGLWRMTRRPSVRPAETGPFAAILPSARSVAMEVTQEVAIGKAATEAESAAKSA
jgi:MFS family permease